MLYMSFQGWASCQEREMCTFYGNHLITVRIVIGRDTSETKDDGDPEKEV